MKVICIDVLTLMFNVFLREMAISIIGYLIDFQEIEIEWGKGLAQKREAEARLKELEVEKDKPFARTRYTESCVVDCLEYVILLLTVFILRNYFLALFKHNIDFHSSV